jgi:hypothetical protein
MRRWHRRGCPDRRKFRPKVLSFKPMDWLTFRQPDEARFRRETPPSVTEILPELLIGEYPRPQDAAWLRQVHGVTAMAIAFIHVHRTTALDEAATYVRKRRICAPSTVMLEEFFAQRAAAARD